MIIARSALRAFLGRQRADSAYAKTLSPDEVEVRLDQLIPLPKFHTAPRHHQKIAFLLGARYPAYLFFLDMGLGKTAVTLNLLQWRKRRGELTRALVLVPNASNVSAWADEAAKHTPGLSVACLEGTPQERAEALAAETDILVATYAGLLSLVCHSEYVLAKRAGASGDALEKASRGWRVHEPTIKVLARQFNAVIRDEATQAANHRTLTFRVLRRLSKTAPIRYGLTGRPFGRDPQMLWAIFYLTDGGETLGETLGLFRAALYTESDNYWSGGSTWTFDQNKKKVLRRMVRHRSIRYSESECLDLPPKVYTVNPVPFPAETLAYYQKLIEEMRTQKEAGVPTLMRNTFLRMRQLESGFLTVKMNEEKISIRFKENPKVEALIERLEEMPPRRKALVFHEFRLSGDYLEEALTAAKISYVRLSGGMGKKARGVQDEFRADPGIRVFLSSSAGGLGLNLQAASYCHFFETPASCITREQEEKRCHRIGQERTVFYHDYVVRGGISEKLLGYLQEGKDLMVALIDGTVQL